MKSSFFITGTGTAVGKTHASAAIMQSVKDFIYWKPVQTGYPQDDDAKYIQNITGLPEERFLPTAYCFKEPLSPHRAAELEKRTLTVKELVDVYRKHAENQSHKRLLIEGAGGILVPINRKETWIDFLQRTGIQIIIAAATGLGTINHTLLTLQQLRNAGLVVRGVIMCGPYHEDNKNTIEQFGFVKVLASFDYKSKNDLQINLDEAAFI